MKIRFQKIMRIRLLLAIAIRGILVFFLFVLFGFSNSDFPYGIQSALARSQLGILGQQAPEIDLNNWIDGDGNPMASIRLSDHRGKVIYLYFFQDW